MGKNCLCKTYRNECVDEIPDPHHPMEDDTVEGIRPLGTNMLCNDECKRMLTNNKAGGYCDDQRHCICRNCPVGSFIMLQLWKKYN